MQTQDQSLIRDNLRLCQQILSKCNSKTVKYNTYYLTQEQKYKSSDGFYYQEPQTPYVLQKKQLIKILPKTQLISEDDINDENDDLIYKSFLSDGYLTIKINFDKVRDFYDRFMEEQIRVALEVKDYHYEDYILYIKLDSGKPYYINMTNWTILRPVFECFYYLFTENTKGFYSKNEILDKYKKLNEENIDWNKLTKTKGDCMKQLKKHPKIKSRIIWEWDYKTKKYHFEIT